MDSVDHLHQLASDQHVATSLGGAFFLVEALRLFRTTEPGSIDWERADRFGWWGVLGEFTRRLLPADHPGGDDPLFGLVAHLRGDQQVGGLQEWLDAVDQTLAAFIVERLGCGLDDLVEVLIERPARLTATRTHVDVHFPLASASVAVRRAGFDRDPGWVPEVGRVIAFHFDDSFEPR